MPRWTPLGMSPALLAVLILGAPAPDAEACAGRGSQPLRIRVPARAGTAVRRAVLSMKRRLAVEPCSLVLSDFRSTSPDRSLHEVLDSRGRALDVHIDSLTFKDGSGKRGCASASILAFTHVGGDTIYVCSGPFLRASWSDPAFAELVLIHEVLHTLGLGEDPPSSREITARVTDRCGDWAVRQAAAAP
jgi:hypothetical protein